jgi:predicted adenine nucleotide alpha hydrolase (AANH) superfamily ATPase
MAVNYQHALDEALRGIKDSGDPKRLLLHSCCGPCSSYVLEYLSRYFEIAVLYYNPNIWPESEFMKRAAVQRELVARMTLPNPVTLIAADYRPGEFDRAAAGLENEPEGGKRCRSCFALRLEEAAVYAKAHGFDYFTTTLSVSPHKDAAALNELGGGLALKHGVKFLFADFKKRNGYRRSVELSEQYGLYRQSYCGCRYSLEAGSGGRSAG